MRRAARFGWSAILGGGLLGLSAVLLIEAARPAAARGARGGWAEPIGPRGGSDGAGKAPPAARVGPPTRAEWEKARKDVNAPYVWEK